MSSDLEFLFENGSFEVLSHGCSINNNEVSIFLKVFIKYNVLQVLFTAYKIGEKSLLI